MEVKLWNELNDQQAEKASGGEGIGQVVSGIIQEYRPLTPNESAQKFGDKNFGATVSRFAQNVNGPNTPV